MTSKIYKAIGWKPWTWKLNYDNEGMCIRCPKCGHEHFTDTVTATVADWTPSEIETHCNHCGEQVNFWAYGNYDPCYMVADRSFLMWLVRINFRIRGIELP